MTVKSRTVFLGMCLAGIALAANVNAADEGQTLELKIPPNSVISDGTLTPKEMAKYVVVAKEQLAYLTSKATEEYAPAIEGKGEAMPAAWMLMSDGVTVKELTLDKAAEQAPASIRVVMFRAALKSIARRGKINAAVILYAGQLSEENAQRALVVEHEHRLGISATKIVPFVIDNGQVKYAQSVTREKPFQLFYDDKSGAPAAS